MENREKTDSFQEYLGMINNLEGYLTVFYENCRKFKPLIEIGGSNPKNIIKKIKFKRAKGCKIAESQLEKIIEIGGKMEFTYNNGLKRRVDNKIGKDLQSEVSSFLKEDSAKGCYSNDCGPTPHKVKSILTIIEEIKNNENNENYKIGFTLDNNA